MSGPTADNPARAAVALVSTATVARMFEVHPKTIQAWARAGRLPKPVIAKPGFQRWLRGDIEAHIHRMADEARAEAAS